MHLLKNTEVLTALLESHQTLIHLIVFLYIFYTVLYICENITWRALLYLICIDNKEVDSNRLKDNSKFTQRL